MSHRRDYFDTEAGRSGSGDRQHRFDVDREGGRGSRKKHREDVEREIEDERRASDHKRRRGRYAEEEDEADRHRESRRDRRYHSEEERDAKRTEERTERSQKKSYPRTVGSLAELGVKEISDSDYFTWMKCRVKTPGSESDPRNVRGETRLRKFPSWGSFRYFKKFVQRWNDCTLPREFYSTHSATSEPSSSQTAYKWSFANNRSKVDKEQLARIREDVDRLTNRAGGNDVGGHVVGPTLPAKRPVAGPSFPPPGVADQRLSHTDRQLGIEDERESRNKDRKMERKRALERAEELAPRSTGREGKIEERRALNAENRKFRERDMGEGLEVDESTLLGGGSDFAAALRARDAATARAGERKARLQQERQSVNFERLDAMRSKEAATMEMFKQMAQAKFGGAGA